MKKIVFLLLMFFAVPLSYASGSVFDLDESVLAEEFADLTQLEEVVLSNPTINLEQAVALDLVTDDFSSASADGFQGSDFSFQWEGFLWGFLCCPIGVFVVALNKHKTKDNKLSFWIGVAASTVLSAFQTIAVGGCSSTTY